MKEKITVKVMLSMLNTLPEDYEIKIMNDYGGILENVETIQVEEESKSVILY